MTMLNDVLIDLVRSKVVDLNEAYLKAVDKVAFVDAIEKMGWRLSGVQKIGDDYLG